MSSLAMKIVVEELKEGMILAQDILNKNGIVLLSKGFEIKDTEKTKKILQMHNIEQIEINKPPVSNNDENEIFFKKYEEVIHFRDNVDIVLKNLKEEFQSIGRGQEINKNHIEDKIKESLKNCEGRINVFQLMEKMKDIDDNIYIHCYNVTLISYSIGKWINLREEELRELTLSGMLCDLGKIKISTKLLNKKEKLTNEEFEQLKKHVLFSYELIKRNKRISKKVKDAVLHHHERIDGSGYPKGLKGEDISVFSRIIAIADVYNALTSKRPYRDKKTPFEAIKVLEEQYMDKLDPGILYVFLNRVGSAFVGNRVKLSDGRIAEIVFIPKQNIYKPIVKIEETQELVNLCDIKNDKIQIELFL